MWTSFEFFIGSWKGTGAGKPGNSEVERTYRLILNEKFMEVINKSTYAPQEKNPKGEVHEDLGLISFDSARKVFVYRQFHVEGFVNQYTLESTADDGKTLTFATESIENIPPGWRARETYRILSPDAFSETFELAAPGKEFEVYSKSNFKRVS